METDERLPKKTTKNKGLKSPRRSAATPPAERIKKEDVAAAPAPSKRRKVTGTGTGEPALPVPHMAGAELPVAVDSSRRVRTAAADARTGVLAGRIVVLKQTDDDVLYREVGAASPAPEPAAVADDGGLRRVLEDYFRLDVPLARLYQEWSDADPNFRQHAAAFRGIRLLRQDPVENLFTFICSSCNNIVRIAQMVDKLCTRYGAAVGASEDGRLQYAFPTLERLAHPDVEADLRALGFGYRAKYIQQAARMIVQDRGAGWPASLRAVPYDDARKALLALPGVGPKVADCICLMSLDKLEAIPVDTHVWQIAARDYGLDLQGKSLTPRIYQSIGDHFRRLYGNRAGWAHSELGEGAGTASAQILFTADLKRFEARRADGSSPVKVKRLRAMDLAKGES